jgi:hypothetical protein
MIKIREKIVVPPKHVDSRIEKHILACLKTRERSCTKNGYIKQVVNIQQISPDEISMADGSISFTVDWVGDIVKPEVSQTYVATKLLFYLEEDDKLLVDVDSMFNCLIVNGKTKNGLYAFDDCPCTVPVRNDNIAIEIELIAVEFKDKKFVTLGRHLCTRSTP